MIGRSRSEEGAVSVEASPLGTTHVASVGKAVQVMFALSPVPGALSVRQIAARTGIPRSTVHALCTTLCEHGLLEPVPGAGYQLGLGLVELGGHVINRTGLLAAAEGAMSGLFTVRGGEVHLGQFVNGWVVYLHRQSGPARLGKNSRVGLRAPAHLTGCGRAVLFAMPWELASGYVLRVCAEEGRPAPDLAEFAEALDQARERGHVVCDSFRPGRTSVAAPIRDGLGRPVGAVSCVGPSGLFSSAVLRRSSADVMSAAGLISRRLSIAMPH